MAAFSSSSLFASLRRRRLLLGVLAALLLAYAFAGFYVVPRVARAQIEAFVTEKLKRRITIADLRFNPFTLAVSVDELKLTEADGAPLLAFRHLYVNAELASLWRRGVVFKEIELVAPDIEAIVAPDGVVNLARLAPAQAGAPAAPAQDPPQASGALLRVHIGRLAVSEGRIGVQDQSRALPFVAAFAPIRFSLDDFRTDVGHSNAYSFAATIRDVARFEWAGAFTVQPLGSTGTFRVLDLRLAKLDAYLEGTLPVKVAGTVGLGGTYRFDLDPLALEVGLPSVSVRDLAVSERGASAQAPVVVPQIDVQDLAFSLTRRDVGIKRLDVRGTRVEVVREADGSINLLRLAGAAPSPSPSPAPPTDATQPPWTVHADVIAIGGAAVSVEDRTTSPAARMRLAPIAVQVDGWTTAPGGRMKLDARVGIDGKGQLGVRGDASLQPLSAALAIDLQRFPLPMLQPYLSQSTGLVLHSGSVGIKGKLTLPAARAGAPPAPRFSGEVRVEDLRASDDLSGEDLLKWKSLAFTGIQVQQQPDRVRIDRIVAQEPYARVIIAQDGSTNIGRVLAPRAGAASPAEPQPAAEKPTQDKPAAARPPIAIRSVEIVDGSANFADFAIQPSFATGIVGLNGQVEGLSSEPGSRAKVAIKGQVDEFSPVEFSGVVNLLSADVYTDMALNFRNIELTTFNPYSGKFAGYSISKGKLSTAMKYRVENRKLDAQHHIIVDNLEFGAQTDSKDAAPIPIKLGIALLKDKRGIIEIDLPVSGTLDDPQFSVVPLLWNGIVNLLAKAIAAPFKALGAMFSGEEDLAFVDFQPGSAALSDAESKKLGTLAKGLVERPELRLSVPFTVVTAADSDAAAQQALGKLAPPADTAKPMDEGAKRKRIAALEGAYRAQLKAAPEYPAEAQGEEGAQLDARIGWLQAALLGHLRPSPAALEALGRQRASAVRDALLANKELDPVRVFVVAKAMEAAAAPGAVRMDLDLE